MSAGVSGVARLHRPGVTISLIKAIVADASGITIPELLADRRMPRIVEARHIVMYLAHRRTAASLPVIGRHLGNRDHTTIHAGIRRFVSRMRQERGLGILVDGLELLVLAEAARRASSPDAEELARAIVEDPRRIERLTPDEITALATAHVDACVRLEALREAAPMAFEPAFKPKENADVH